MKGSSFRSLITRVAAQGGIIVFAVMALEIAVMISPFAFFFYSVFNPLFKVIDEHSALRWLTTFFLPHMVLPPTPLLAGIRVLGSVLFLLGMLTFIVCALQVYLGKIFGWGIAEKGLYGYVRHPQYLALEIWGAGMCILWPRFIVLVSLSIMCVLYYFLARDEERRMSARFGDGYTGYINRTGMFLPRLADAWFSGFMRESTLRPVAVPAMMAAGIIGTGFALRALTLNSLPFATQDNVTLVSILPEDAGLGTTVLKSLTRMQGSGAVDFMRADRDYLGYLMPADFVMQGMIANTGSDFHLFKQHNTISMITEWVLHPFEHLRASPALHMAGMHHIDPAVARRHHCPIEVDQASMACGSCPYRRVILVEIDHPEGRRYSGSDLLSFGTIRIPVCYLDINTKTGEILQVRHVERSTAWHDVPTPAL